MDENSILKLRLSDIDKENLRKELNSITYDPLGNEQYIQKIRRAIYQALPSNLLDLMSKQKAAKDLHSSIIIDNLPIDNAISGSPDFNQTGQKFKSGVLSENIITAFSLLIGEPYSIHFEGKELVNNLTPQANTKFDYTGLGSEVELDFHIENAALQYISEDDYSPVGLFFLGIRIDESTVQPNTFISDARKALKLLSASDIEILYGNNYQLHLPHRWRNAFNSSQEKTALCPVLRGTLNLPRISVAFYNDMVTPINQHAKAVLINFHNAIKEVSESITITPGRLVYVDNRFTLHSRTKFNPTYDENGCPYRWVQRVFVAPSLWPFRDFQSVGDRVFLPNLSHGVKDVSSILTKVA